MKKHGVFSLRYLFFDIVKLTALPGLLFFRPKRIYEEGEKASPVRGGALFFSNHTGFFDPVYLHMAVPYRRLHFVCLDDFMKNPVSRLLFKGFHCIPINRENFNMRSFRLITEHLEVGDAVMIFPEGHVVFDEKQEAAFKSGMVLMALRAKAPLVPVCIGRRAHWYSRLRVALGSPVYPAMMYGETPGLSEIREISLKMEEREEALKTLLQEEGNK